MPHGDCPWLKFQRRCSCKADDDFDHGTMAVERVVVVVGGTKADTTEATKRTANKRQKVRASIMFCFLQTNKKGKRGKRRGETTKPVSDSRKVLLEENERTESDKERGGDQRCHITHVIMIRSPFCALSISSLLCVSQSSKVCMLLVL